MLIDYNQLSREELIATIKEITLRLQYHFKNHIGAEESTSPHEIFEAVMGLNPDTLSIYKREYWWNVIKRVISGLRSSEELFVIHKGQNWFVLQTELEASYYKRSLSRMIKAFESNKVKADRWVQNKTWIDI